MKKIKLLSILTTFFILPAQAFAGEFEILVGPVYAPKGVADVNDAAGGIGILYFFSNFIRLVTIVASLWVVLNVVLAAFTYITGGGKAENHSKVRDKLTMSFLGLLIIVISYTMAGLIGLIFFGDSTSILNPTIKPI